MTAVKTSHHKPEYSYNTHGKKRNCTDDKKRLNSPDRAGALSKRTGITVEDRYRQESKMIRPDKRYVKKDDTGCLPPYPLYLSEDHALFYPYARKTNHGGFCNNIPHLFPHNTGCHKDNKEDKK